MRLRTPAASATLFHRPLSEAMKRRPARPPLDSARDGPCEGLSGDPELPEGPRFAALMSRAEPQLRCSGVACPENLARQGYAASCAATLHGALCCKPAARKPQISGARLVMALAKVFGAAAAITEPTLVSAERERSGDPSQGPPGGSARRSRGSGYRIATRAAQGAGPATGRIIPQTPGGVHLVSVSAVTVLRGDALRLRSLRLRSG